MLEGTRFMSPTPREGDVIAGKYRVESVLGEGGMGVVVAAFRTDLEQKVAIKVLNEAALKNPLILQRFEREARAMVKIQSRHVARVSDVGKLESGAPFMVMEFLVGRDLSRLLEEDGLPPMELAVDWVLQACDAVSEAHAHGVVHRDLKPGNLYLADQPDGSIEVKVLDFGISKSLEHDKDESKSLTKTTDVFGSPMYMSPEQLMSTAKVDHRTDIWALGVILYELLTGEPPFSTGTVAEIWSSILDKQIPLPSHRRPEIPRGLEDAVMRCLTRDVEQRYQTVADLAEDLAPFGSGEARASVERAKRFKKGLRAIPDAAPSGPGSRAVPPPRQSSPGSRGLPAPPKSSPGSRDLPAHQAISEGAPTPSPSSPTAATSAGSERLAPPPPKSSSGKPRLALDPGHDESEPPPPVKPRLRPVVTATDWQTHDRRSHGGTLVTLLFVAVIGAVAATAWYLRTHAPPRDTAAPSTAPTVGPPRPPATTAPAAAPSATSAASSAPEPTATAAATSGPRSKPPRPAHSGGSAKHPGAGETEPTTSPTPEPPAPTSPPAAPPPAPEPKPAEKPPADKPAPPPEP
jgi:serine/threonine-protein kinase